jgi:hypothetical protein
MYLCNLCAYVTYVCTYVIYVTSIGNFLITNGGGGGVVLFPSSHYNYN